MNVGEAITLGTLESLGCVGVNYPDDASQIACARNASVEAIIAASSNPFFIWVCFNIKR